jgi:hypothetical protein
LVEARFDLPWLIEKLFCFIKTKTKTKKKKKHDPADIVLLDGRVVVFRSAGDALVYVLGTPGASEVSLDALLDCLLESLALSLRHAPDVASLLARLDVLLLTLDEAVDGGVVLELDPEALAARVGAKEESEVPLADQTLTQAIGVLKNTISKYT